MKKALVIIVVLSAVVFVLGFILIRSEGYQDNPPQDNVEFHYEKIEF